MQKPPIGVAFREVFRRGRALTIGTVGGSITGLLACDQAKKTSPERASFGTGHREGVIAAESASNAMVGPLLTLSTPARQQAVHMIANRRDHGHPK